MPTDDPTPPEAEKKPLVIGRITIAAENVAEWEALNEKTHGFIIANKKIPKEIRSRMYFLEGLSQAQADWLASFPEGGELNDCHALTDAQCERRDAAQRRREEKARLRAEKRKPHPLPLPGADRPPAAKGQPARAKISTPHALPTQPSKKSRLTSG